MAGVDLQFISNAASWEIYLWDSGGEFLSGWVVLCSTLVKQRKVNCESLSLSLSSLIPESIRDPLYPCQLNNFYFYFPLIVKTIKVARRPPLLLMNR